MARQMEIDGTQRKYSKAMRDAADEYAEAVKAESKAKTKRKNKHELALAQMEKEDDGKGIDVYVDTEADPPFVLKRETTTKVKKSAYKAPKPADPEADGSDSKKLRSVN